MTTRTVSGRALIVILREPPRREWTLGEWWRTLLAVLGEVPAEIRSRLNG